VDIIHWFVSWPTWVSDIFVILVVVRYWFGISTG